MTGPTSGLGASELRVAVDGGMLAALVYDGIGTPIVLVHGAGHNAAIWAAVAAHLTRQRVVAVDLRGHGQTTAVPNFATATLAADLAVVVSDLSLDKPVLVGHSWGANIAVEAVARQHVDCSALVLVEGNVGSYGTVYAGTEWSPPEQAEEIRAPDPITGEEVEKLASSLDEIQAAMLRRSYQGATSGVLHPTPAERGARECAAWAQELTELYDHVRCPVLLIRATEGFGERSPLANAAIAANLAHLEERHPEFTVRWMPCPHAIPYFLPRELAEHIAAFGDEEHLRAVRH